MTAKLKLAAYVVLIALAIWFGRAFYSSYNRIGQTAAAPATNAAPAPVKPAPRRADVTAATNLSTNTTLTNLASNTTETNGSNAVPQPVPAPAPVTNNSTPPSTETAASGVVAANSLQGGRSIGYLAAFVGAMIGLGILIAYDATQFLGSRAVEYLFNDEGEGMRDPEYERAEQTWVNGKPLEAIEMMREYLKKNPRAQYAALRIAEIYEKDLRNYVAASLEYEEVLKKKLPAERWGWAAIHLCNIYSRMGKQDKMKELLERIAQDYPKTGAAKKARRTLGLPEPSEEEKPEVPATAPKKSTEPDAYDDGQVFDLDEVIATPDEPPAAAPEAAAETPAPTEPAKPNLPPGFRKKK